MADSTADKSQQATPHRRQQARDAGQFAKSQDLVAAAMLMAALGGLIWFGNAAAVALRYFTEVQLASSATLAINPDTAVATWRQTMAVVAPVVLPLLGMTLAAAVLANVLQTGLRWLPQSLRPDFSRVSPLAGAQRIFSLAGVFRLLLSIIKIAAVVGVAAVNLYQERDTILGLAALDTQQVAGYLTGVVLWTSLKIAAMLLVLALADYAFQRWKHEQQLKMTPEEVREELRNLQGDPQIAARRRLVQRQLTLGRVETTVPRAQLVIASHSDLCVALRYDIDSMAAPVVVAKGTGPLAARIGRLALEHAVPIVEDELLSRALDQEVAVNQAIPQQLFGAVAEALAAVQHRAGSRSAAGVAAAR